MSLVTQVMIADKYGLRLDTSQLAELLGITKHTLYNQFSSGTCPIKTYVEAGKRFADYRDVAEYFDEVRATAT